MLEKPAISDETLLTALHDHFDLSAAALEFLPIGYDAFAGVYRVRVADGRDYFLKVKKGGVAPVTVAIPQFLKASGIREVIAPLPTTAGELWGAVDDFGMILYPFIEGADAITIDMTADQAGTFGRALKRIHSLGLPPETSALVPREDFSPRWRHEVREWSETFATGNFDDPFWRRFAAGWNALQHQIDPLVDRAEALAQVLVNRPSSDWCLCHSDIHQANILLSKDGAVYIVDWDQPIIAPKERDLMFIGGGCAGKVNEGEEEFFYRGYGHTDVDWVMVAYYRYERIVQDFAVFAQEALLIPDTSEADKNRVLMQVNAQFDPGSVVDIARQTEARLPAAFRATGF